MVRLATLTPEGWHRTHRTIDGMIVTEFQFRLRPNFGKNWGTNRGIGGLRESVGHIQPRAEFSRIYGLRMTHASLQNPQKVNAKKSKNPPKPLLLTFFQQKKRI